MDEEPKVRKRLNELLSQMDESQLEEVLQKIKSRNRSQQEKETEFLIGQLTSEHDELTYVMRQKKKEANKEVLRFLELDSQYSDLVNYAAFINKEIKRTRKEIENLITQRLKLQTKQGI